MDLRRIVHKLQIIHLNGNHHNNLRVCWKCNNTLLNDWIFCDTVKCLTLEIFGDIEMDDVLQWGNFRYRVRECAAQRSKDIKTSIWQENLNLTNEQEKVQINQLQMEIDHEHIEMALGASIRSPSRKTLEKRNRKRSMMKYYQIPK